MAAVVFSDTSGHRRQSIGLEAARVHVTDESDHSFHVDLLVVVDGKVATVWAEEEPATLYRPRDHLHVLRVHRVVSSADHERRHPILFRSVVRSQQALADVASEMILSRGLTRGLARILRQRG